LPSSSKSSYVLTKMCKSCTCQTPSGHETLRFVVGAPPKEHTHTPTTPVPRDERRCFVGRTRRRADDGRRKDGFRRVLHTTRDRPKTRTPMVCFFRPLRSFVPHTGIPRIFRRPRERDTDTRQERVAALHCFRARPPLVSPPRQGVRCGSQKQAITSFSFSYPPLSHEVLLRRGLPAKVEAPTRLIRPSVPSSIERGGT